MLTHATRKKKENKCDKNSERRQLSLFADAMIIYRENLKELIKAPKLTTNYNKVSGHNVNIQKPVVFLHTNDEQGEFEI